MLLTRCFGWGKDDKLDESGVRMRLLSDSVAALQGPHCKGQQRTQVCRDRVRVELLWVLVKVEKPQPIHMLLGRETDAEGWGVGEGGISRSRSLGHSPRSVG